MKRASKPKKLDVLRAEYDLKELLKGGVRGKYVERYRAGTYLAPRSHSIAYPMSMKRMKRWPIERSWMVVSAKADREFLRSSDLARYRACAVLGAAGLGKTFELKHLVEADLARGLDARMERLAALGQTADGLASRLASLATGATSDTVLYLDALDEVMVPVGTAGPIVARWVTDTLGASKPRLRISCRSAVWHPGVEEAIREVYGADEFATAILQPLSPEDLREAAQAEEIDATAFLREVEAKGVLTLAQQPLTLGMLLQIHADHGALPKRRRDLFARAMERLVLEPRERRRDGTAVNVPLADVLEAAERLACYCLLSAKDTIDLGDAPLASALSIQDLQGLPAATRPLDSPLLEAICRSGLCEGDPPDRFRFAHRQFAEYLAGRRLAKLLPHQAKALLAAGPGWQAGVAGPLRETAAFAAVESAEIASWVTDCDPEVVGLSDVADEALRRQATLNLLEKFRRHEMTDAQLRPGKIELRGFQYSGAQSDLEPILKERQDGSEDVLDCVVGLIESWEFRSMSDALAELILDVSAPLHSRQVAGYALARLGTSEARRRLLPLLAAGPDDPDLNLKGLALHCNWPDGLTTTDLLAALAPPQRRNYIGAYESFLLTLDHDGFDARDDRLGGLRWARQFVRQSSDHQATTWIAKRIAIAALGELDKPEIADALADLILDAARTHGGSPFVLAPRHSLGDERSCETQPFLPLVSSVRRTLLDTLAARAIDEREIWWWGVAETPGLIVIDDFPWLLVRATTPDLPMRQRENYANLARTLHGNWMDDVASVEAWLAAREIEPVKSRFPLSLSTELDSEEAAELRRNHARMMRGFRPPRRKRLQPPPKKRVQQALELCERDDPRFFLNLCEALTLEEYSTHYGFSRFLTTTPGWTDADKRTRRRICDAARRLLLAPSDEAQRARTAPFNSILPGYMPAIWLLMEHDPSWLDSLPADWWREWAWYVLRELHPYLDGEPAEPKLALLRMVHARAPVEVRNSLETLSTSGAEGSRDLLKSLLEQLCEIPDDELDARLSARLEAGDIPGDRIGDVAQFVLSRSGDRALSACLTLIEPRELVEREDMTISAAVALLHERTRDAWSAVLDLLRRRPDLAVRVLDEFAHGRRVWLRWQYPDGEHPGLADLSRRQIGELVSLLLQAFPPEADPQYTGAHVVGPNESARMLRNRLISWLGDQRDIEAVEALRALEAEFGLRYGWLRHPRARAEWAYRLSRWVPISPGAVAELLADREKRLIRSGRDAVDGVVAAIDSYARHLRHDSPSELEDLWNQKPRTPKDEERVSDKLCRAVRDYFRDFAVGAEREVQVFRRKLSRAAGGAPGSEVDLLFRVAPTGTVEKDPIIVPIEVKLAHNPEARTGIRDQLVGRYMSELGTNLGVFVVAWMGKRKSAGGYRPLWDSPEAAKNELEEQIRQLQSATAEALEIRAVVVDASLPLAATPHVKKKTSKSQLRKAAARTKRKSPSKAGARRPKAGGSKKQSASRSPPRLARRAH